jgi:tRNA(Ile)-lysidine synthase
MARRVLGPARLQLVHALRSRLAEEDRSLLIASSGGADSLALADAAVQVARRRGISVRGAVVDHGLQAASGQVAAEAAARLVGLGVDEVGVLPVRVIETGAGPEAAARDARYAALRAEAAAHGSTVLLGHTRDDQAETVLLGLARGSGIRSLAGMAPRVGPFLRPLLGVPRSLTRAACAELGIRPWSDPHNHDPSFARSRVRHDVLPVLETELGPGIAEALARTAELARDDAELLDRLAAEAQPAVLMGEELTCDALSELPRSLRSRIIRTWLDRHGGRDLGQAHVSAVDALVIAWHGQGPVQVPNLSIARHDGRLTAAAQDRGAQRGVGRNGEAVDP